MKEEEREEERRRGVRVAQKVNTRTWHSWQEQVLV